MFWRQRCYEQQHSVSQDSRTLSYSFLVPFPRKFLAVEGFLHQHPGETRSKGKKNPRGVALWTRRNPNCLVKRATRDKESITSYQVERNEHNDTERKVMESKSRKILPVERASWNNCVDEDAPTVFLSWKEDVKI